MTNYFREIFLYFMKCEKVVSMLHCSVTLMYYELGLQTKI